MIHYALVQFSVGKGSSGQFSRGQAATRVAGFTTSFRNVMRTRDRDAMVKALTRPEVIAA